MIAPEGDIAKGAVSNQAGHLQHQDADAHDQKGDRHLLSHGAIEDVARHCRVENQDRGGKGNSKTPAEAASNDTHDHDGVDGNLQGEG